MATVSDAQETARSLSVSDITRVLLRRQLISQRSLKLASQQLNPDDSRHPILQVADLQLADESNRSRPFSIEVLTRIVADACNLEYVRIDPLKIDVEAVTSLVSEAYAKRYQFLPISVSAQEIVVATCQPYIVEWQRELEPILKKPIRRVFANPSDIHRYLKEFYGVKKSIGIADRETEISSTTSNLEQLTEIGDNGEPDANDHHIVHLVDWLLQYAFEQRASDIHIEPRREQSNVRFRIDGVLHLVHQLDTRIVQAIVSRLKSLGRMNVADKRRPQDGRIKAKGLNAAEVELRLSTMPTTFGEKLVLRIFNPEKLQLSFAELGFSNHDISAWQSMVENPHGIILVTGPTGSGKTTTLYSALKQLARPENNVCTIEDPIEMVEPSFNQMQVQPAIDLSFASGVRTLLRQDPDIIMVGEIRDLQTAEVAAQAALTGHLVLSTLHTNDAPSAVTRLIDIGLPSYLISATLLGVVAQRLVRTICEHCKIRQDISASDWEQLGRHISNKFSPVDAAIGEGCDDCRQTGYRGREGIYEIMTVSDKLRGAFTRDPDITNLRKLAIQSGMTPLREAGARKVASGRTTLNELLAAVPVTH